MVKENKIQKGQKVHMIVDTGATKTVIGETTLIEMIKSFSLNQRNRIMQEKESDLSRTAKFKFGDGKTIAAQKVFHIPFLLAGRIIELKMFVMPGKVSFLLGIEALTKMKAIIDPAKTEINLCGQRLKGADNKSGHFVLEMMTAFGTEKQELEECVFQFSDEIVHEKERERESDKQNSREVRSCSITSNDEIARQC